MNKQNSMFYDRETMDEILRNTYDVLRFLFINKKKFSIIIWNNDDWDIPLPDTIMDRFPDHVPLDLNPKEIERCELQDDGSIILRIVFGENIYSKILKPTDVIAVIDSTGRVICANNFKDIDLENIQEEFFSTNDLKESLLASGLQMENIEASMEVFGL